MPWRKRAAASAPRGEDRAAFGAVRQDQPLVRPQEHHVMVARDRAAADRGIADRAGFAREAGAVAAAFLALASPPRPRRGGFAEMQRGARGRVGLAAWCASTISMSHARARARARRARRGRRAAPRRARCWRRAGPRPARAAAAMRWSARSSSPVVPTRIGMPAAMARSRLWPSAAGDGEIDQHVAMVGVDREAGIGGDRLGDRAAHAAVGGEQGQADGLSVGAHGSRDGAALRRAQSRAAAGAPARRRARGPWRR